VPPWESKPYPLFAQDHRYLADVYVRAWWEADEIHAALVVLTGDDRVYLDVVIPHD
jgi:hypothetical protein